ncbi:unnamed protein product [Ectocarpus sp. CCAP 1310/34]|nr:unnamed protein product [Ectocarpus sp. CCAP 1310/34]
MLPPTGCQVLVLQRAVKTFRLGPHPAPIIPVDVVSRAIVHSALGWGGPLTSSSPAAAAAAANIMAAIPDIPGSPAAESRPDVVIRNLAWATHPVLGLGDSSAIVARKRDPAVCGGGVAQEGGGMADVVAGRAAECTAAVGSGAREGRMPSFREISGLLYDYAVLRGMRPSLEALAMRSSFAAASVSPPPATPPGTPCVAHSGDTSGGRWSSSPSCPQSPYPPSPSGGSGEGRRGNPPTAGDGGLQGRGEAGLLHLRGGGLKPSLPRLAFDAMHLLLDRSPVWALQGLAALAERVGVFGGSSGHRHGGGGGGGGGRGRGGRRRPGISATLRRLDKLAALPSVYETFTWQVYFFDSALRVPEGLKPAGYALETALASELLQRSLPGGAEEGAKASPERRQSILRELGLQIRTHRSGGLRCGGRGDDTRTSLRAGGAPEGNRVAVGEEHGGGGGGGGGRPLGHNGDDIETAMTMTMTNGVTAKKNSDDEVPGAGDRLTRRRRRRSLSVLCGRADRLVPWPALAWWAATLPGSAARGGVTLWVRLVAFAVRVVMSRAASAVAVDVDSFREAAPPGYGVGADGASRGRSVGGDGVKEDGAATAPSVDGEAAGGGGGSDGGYIGGGGGGGGRGEKSAATAAAAGADGGDGWRAGGCGGRAGAGRGEEGEGAGKVVVVLLPTHRSYLDFVLVSLFCASMRSFPGLSWLRVPKVAAADGPFGKEGTPLRWLMGKLGAFFIRRGHNSEPHSDLRRRLEALHEIPRGKRETSQKVPSGEQGIVCDGAAATRDEAGDSRCTSGNERIPGHHPQAASDGNGGGSADGGGGGAGGRWPGPCESDPCQRGLETLEVFVEGTRSRDRRFLAPKTGLIRALQGAREGATLWLVPVSISYERVPEQGRLAEELLARGCSREAGEGGAPARGQHTVGAVGLTGLLRWTMKALSGRVRLGKVLMRAGDPVALNSGGDVRAALLEVRRRHRSGTVVTPYHLREASEHLGLEEGDVRECIHELGGTVWEGDVDGGVGERSVKAYPIANPQPLPTSRYASDVPTVERFVSSATPASDDMEAWMNHLQWVHLLHDRLRGHGRGDGNGGGGGGGSRSRSWSRWAEWLVPQLPPCSNAAALTADSAARLAAGREENEKDIILRQPSTLWLSDSTANGGADADAGVVGDTAAAAVAETARNSPRLTESSSGSCSPSWVMATGASTSSCSSSSTPSSFELTSSLDDDGATPCTAATAASSPSSFEITPSEETATSPLETTPSVDDGHGHGHGDGDGSRASYSRRNDDDDGDGENQEEAARSSSVASRRVLAAVLREFDRAESAVAEARAALVERGFSRPSPGHVLQVLVRKANEGGPWRGEQGSGSSDDEEGARLGVRGCGGAVRGAPSLFLASVALSLGRGGDDPRGNNAGGNGTNFAATDDDSEAGFKTSSAAAAAVAAAESLSVSRRSVRGGGGGQHEPTTAVEDDDDWFGAVDGDKEAVGSWGFRDSGFCIESDRSDGANPFVVMRGNRYGICGRPLRGLLPFVREAIGVPISAEGRARRAASPPPPSLPPSRLLKPKPSSLDVGRGATEPAPDVGSGGKGDCAGGGRVHESAGTGAGQQTRTLLESMVEALGLGFDVKDQVSLSRQERARHGAGHGLSDIWSLRSGKMRRSPDAVMWPTSEYQVSRLMEWAGAEGVCLIPFGGGTNVTRALEVPPLDVEPRPVMDRVLDVDVANGTAHIQAGVVGRKLAAELAERGVTMGHEPDSLEFSTLGGWVATRASGMKRGRWAPGAFSRTSVGLDLASAMLGSEGCLGIITSVVVKVVPLPQVSEHASFLFRDFKLRLGKAMKGDEDDVAGALRSTVRSLVPKAQSAYIWLWKGWGLKETSAVTMVFEGSRQEAALQKREVSRIARSHGALSGGASAGKSGYDLTFAIAYLRDFALLFDVLGESFETFVSWTALEGLCEKVNVLVAVCVCFASRVSSPVITDLVLGMKRALDPHNVLGARNNFLAAEPPTADGVKADT